jgi:hypothetical protein
MSGETIISQSGSLNSSFPFELSGNFYIEGNGVTVTTGPMLNVSAFTNFTVASSATFELGSGFNLGVLDTIDIAAGGTLDIATNLNLGSAISFESGATGGDLILNPGVGASILSSVNNFQGGDEIDFRGVGAPAGPTSFSEVSSFGVTDFAVTLAGGGTEIFSLPGNVGNSFSLASDGAGGFLFEDTACFAPGTRILTTSGEVPVDDLIPGDIAILADGTQSPITFIGHRRLDLARHPRPQAVRPVRIAAGALADGVPSRDLIISPDHALLLDGVLVQVKDLVDGVTIVQDDTLPTIRYYHVELASHGILLVEGTPAESYLDTGHRGMFDNSDAPLILHPDLMQMRREAESIAPLCMDGDKLTAIRGRLLSRKQAAGLSIVHSLAITASAVTAAAATPLTPATNTAEDITFNIPAGATQLSLAIPSFTPAAFEAASADRRRLGLAISAILINDRQQDINSLSPTGLHPRAPGEPSDWTTESLTLTLPPHTQTLTLKIAARPKHWQTRTAA